MQCTKKINKDTYYIGVNDRRIELFENVFPVKRGMSYNSYFIDDDKTVVLDTVDKVASDRFFENLEYVLGDKKLDYLIVNHMEPDHCGTMEELVLRYPEVKIVGNTKTISMIKQFFNFDIDSRAVIIKEGDTLNTGNHTLSFVMAPMVHWPEAMVTYDTLYKVLFSADAFGTFGAIDGNLFADEVNFERDWLDDARSYYVNIVGKYGVQVTNLLKKASGLDIEMICPLHGPVWRDNISWFIDKYVKWASYTPEEDSVMICYGSVYGNTANACDILAANLAERGVKNIKVYDVSKAHPSDIVATAFKYSHLVFASITYNNGIFCNMETVLKDLISHNLQNRTVAVIENGSWGILAGKLIKEEVAKMKNMTVLENEVSIKSSLKEDNMSSLDALAKEIVNSIKGE